MKLSMVYSNMMLCAELFKDFDYVYTYCFMVFNKPFSFHYNGTSEALKALLLPSTAIQHGTTYLIFILFSVYLWQEMMR